MFWKHLFYHTGNMRKIQIEDSRARFWAILRILVRIRLNLPCLTCLNFFNPRYKVCRLSLFRTWLSSRLAHLGVKLLLSFRSSSLHCCLSLLSTSSSVCSMNGNEHCWRHGLAVRVVGVHHRFPNFLEWATHFATHQCKMFTWRNFLMPFVTSFVHKVR